MTRNMKTLAKVVYKKLFTKHLLVTNTLVSGGLMGFGDFLQQNIERFNEKSGKFSHDWRRTGRMTTYGLMAGPFVHGWYKFLDSVLIGTSKMTVAKKVFVDQIVASPLLLAGFFLGMGALEGKSVANCVQELKEKFVFVYLVDCCFWPPVQTINFFFLPTHLRVAYVNSAVLIWIVFLSYIKHKDNVVEECPVNATIESSTLKKTISEKSTVLCETGQAH